MWNSPSYVEIQWNTQFSWSIQMFHDFLTVSTLGFQKSRKNRVFAVKPTFFSGVLSLGLLFAAHQIHRLRPLRGLRGWHRLHREPRRHLAPSTAQWASGAAARDQRHPTGNVTWRAWAVGMGVVSRYVYIYIYTYTHIYIYTYTHIYIYTYIHIHIYI